MNGSRFDAISKRMAEKLSRRQALVQSGLGIAAGTVAMAGMSTLNASPKAAAQEASPVSAEDFNPLNTPMLFVQAFKSGTLEALDEPHRYTLNLERGLGQTIYFSDRPARIAGAMPTGDFLDVLGFMDDNPPNAAIMVEREEGHTDFAVVELFKPVYDTEKSNLTYEISVLESWEKVSGMQFTKSTADDAPTTFNTAHLLIDGIADCPDAEMSCRRGSETIGVLEGHSGHCYSWGNFACFPCEPWGESPSYFDDLCNQTYSDCGGDCYVWNYCSRDAPLGNTWCQDSDTASNFGS